MTVVPVIFVAVALVNKALVPVTVVPVIFVAVALVNKYDGEWPRRWFKEISDYLSIDIKKFPKASLCFEEPIMSENYYDLLCDNFRSPHLWSLQDNKWILKSQVKENNNNFETLKAWQGNI